MAAAAADAMRAGTRASCRPPVPRTVSRSAPVTIARSSLVTRRDKSRAVGSTTPRNMRGSQNSSCALRGADPKAKPSTGRATFLFQKKKETLVNYLGNNLKTCIRIEQCVVSVLPCYVPRCYEMMPGPSWAEVAVMVSSQFTIIFKYFNLKLYKIRV